MRAPLRFSVLALLSASSLCLSGMAADKLELSKLFSSDMVLQREIPASVWGEAVPGSTVSVEFAGQRKDALVEANGEWKLVLDPLSLDKQPKKMTVSAGSERIVLDNILVGDVWLCSGQSNMAMGIGEDFGGKEAIAAADKPLIRIFLVRGNEPSPVPASSLKGDCKWKVCTPKTLAFSAAGYYFGRELNERLDIPIGLIGSYVGGSTAQAWTPLDALKGNPLFAKYVEQRDADAALSEADFAARRKKLAELALLPGRNVRAKDDEGSKGEAAGWQKPGLDVSGWDRVIVPTGWFSDKNVYGAIWYRRVVEIPESWAGKDLVLRAGAIDDFETTYFNGEKIGETNADTPEHWALSRVYRVPGKLVKAGPCVIAVRVFNEAGGGGFTGVPDELRLSLDSGAIQQDIMLAGEWSRKIERDAGTFPVESPELITWRHNVPSSLFNGMIAPLIPFALRGVVWYQGEFNSSEGYGYRELFPAMIEAWRAKWGQGDFPFYFVQLPGFGAPTSLPPGSSGSWAEIRESQALTAAKVFNSGMAVAIDLGEAGNIHPRYKLDVGKRLALVALKKTYGVDCEWSGPVCDSVVFEKGQLRLRFLLNGGGLVAKDGKPLRGFAVCGRDRIFHWADARIEGDTIVLSSPEVSAPTAVRYAWSGNPQCNLFGKNGLPAAPFRSDSFQIKTQVLEP